MKRWTPEETALLVKLFPDTKTEDVALALNRTVYSCIQKAHVLGLRKSTEFLDIVMKPFIQAAAKYRYKKGNVPQNKGKLQEEYMTPEAIELTKKTRFKKGNIPVNTRLVGTVRERPDKSGKTYKYIKIADGIWELYHRHTWEKSNGPIPAGYRIHFKDKDTMNCHIDNLEMLTPQEAMDLNRITSLTKELQEIIKLKNKLNTKIKQNGKK